MNAYPRVAIHFCTGCKWNLRAAWYLQELLSTFGNQLGEVALLPASSGTFIIELVVAEGDPTVTLWDRRVNGGFPDSKDLKKLVRDVISPKQDLGHIDKHDKAVAGDSEKSVTSVKSEKSEIPSISAKSDNSGDSAKSNICSPNGACTDCGS